MTGLSGAGKSTLANALQQKLTSASIPTEVIDGDTYRKTINKDLGFSADDRKENISRLAKIASRLSLQGIVAIVAAINPFEKQRMELSKTFGAEIIWIRCDIQTLIERDTKGLYYKALLPDDHPDKLRNLSGINDPYEIPQHADCIIDTSKESINNSAQQLLTYVFTKLGIDIT